MVGGAVRVDAMLMGRAEAGGVEPACKAGLGVFPVRRFRVLVAVDMILGGRMGVQQAMRGHDVPRHDEGMHRDEHGGNRYVELAQHGGTLENWPRNCQVFRFRAVAFHTKIFVMGLPETSVSRKSRPLWWYVRRV